MGQLRQVAKSACLKKWWARPSWTQNLGSHGGWWTKAAKVDLICMGLAAGPRWSRDGIRWRHAVPQGPSRVSYAKVYLFLCHGSTRCEVCEFWSRHCTHVLRHGPWGICSLWACFAPCRQVRLLEKVMSPPQLNSEFGQSWRLMDQSRESRFNLHGSGCRSQVVPRWYPMTACCATRSQQSELSCQGVPFPLPRVYQMRSLWVLITSLYTRVAAWPMRHLFLVDAFRAMPPSPLAWKSDEPAPAELRIWAVMGGWWTKAAKVDLICMGLAAGPRWSRDGIRWRHAVPQGPSRVSWAAKVYLFLCHGSTRCEVCEVWSRHCTHVLRHGPWGICSLWTCFAPCRQVRLLEKVMSPPQLNSEFGQSWRLMDQSRESRFNLHGSGCRSQVVPRWYPMTACCATRSQQSELSRQGVPFPLPRVYQMRSLWVLITSLYTRVAAWPMRHLFLVDVFRAMPPSPLAWKSDEPATRGTLSAIL